MLTWLKIYHRIGHVSDDLSALIWIAWSTQIITHNFQVAHIIIPFIHPFYEIEWRKVFLKFNDDRTSNEKNISKVHNLVGHTMFIHPFMMLDYLLI